MTELSDIEKEQGLRELESKMRKSAIVWTIGIAIGAVSVITIGVQTNIFVALGVVGVALSMALVEASTKINPSK